MNILKAKKYFVNAKFSIHPSFFLLVLFCYFFGGLSTLVLISLLALMHESAHAICAKKLGYKLRQIRLLPFGAELSGEDFFLPGHEIKIALAGPLFNFGLCVVCVALMWCFPGWYGYLYNVFLCSLSLGIFNLFPFFPLDGGRIFLGIISKRIDRKRCLFILRIITFCFGITLMALCFFSIFFGFNVTIGIMGISLIVSCLGCKNSFLYERISSKQFKRKKILSGLEEKNIVILESTTILSALAKVDVRYFTQFKVVDKFFNSIGSLSEIELENYLQILGGQITLKNLLEVKKTLTKNL